MNEWTDFRHGSTQIVGLDSIIWLGRVDRFILRLKIGKKKKMVKIGKNVKKIWFYTRIITSIPRFISVISEKETETDGERNGVVFRSITS